MPEFTFRATDRMGNAVDGKIAAEDELTARDRIRAMGYSPITVGGSSPGAAVVTAAPVGADAGGGSPRRGAIDLSQPYYPDAVEEPTVMGAEGSYSASAAEATTSIPAPQGHLEPWERSAQAASASGVQPTVAMTPGGPEAPRGLSPGAGDAGRLENYRRQLEISRSAANKPLFQRFKEIIVFPIFSGVVIKDLAEYYRQLGTLVGAGLPIYQALTALEANTHNPRLKEIAAKGMQRVSAGGRFSEVMAEYPWIFETMQVELIRASEAGGMLDVMFNQLAHYVDHELEIRRIITRETLYPKIVMFVALMILGRPGFAGGQMSLVSFVLGGMGKSPYTGVQYFWDTLGFGLEILLFLFVLSSVCKLFLFNVPGVREAYDGVKLKIPVLGKIVRMFAVAKFCRTFAALYRGGFGMAGTLDVAGPASGNAVVARAAKQAARVAERGQSVSASLAATGIFTSMTIDMFATGEVSGNLDGMVDKIADFYESEATMKSHQSAMILGVAVFLIVAMMVASQVIGQYTNYGNAATGGGGGGE